MSAIQVIHVAPELPSAVGGVADYTSVLSHRLSERADEDVELMLVHAGHGANNEIDVDFPHVNLEGACSAAILEETLRGIDRTADRQSVVLLEYSGYGYAEKGAPLWLFRGLRRACGPDGLPLITMFHEIRTASWKPWTKAFWLSPVQTGVAGLIARLSSGIMTTHPTAADRLRRYAGGNTRVDVSPVFSNVGEPPSRSSYPERSPRAVLFGGEASKAALYETHRAAVQAELNRWDIDEVIDIGAPSSVGPHVFEAEGRVRGVLPADEVSRLLRGARIGILKYPVAYATKSGVLAAYMAHGVIPVVVDPDPLGTLLRPYEHYVPASLEPSGGGAHPSPDTLSQNAYDWYHATAHSRRAAATVRELMEAILP